MKPAGRVCALLTLVALAASGAGAQTCSAISIVPLPAATVNMAYSTMLSTWTLGGTPPFSYSSAILPPGLTMDSTGAISGTPMSATNGSFAGSVTVTDSCPQTVQVSLTIQVSRQPLTITTTVLPFGIQGAPYNQAVQAAGGFPPYSFSLIPPAALAGTGLSVNPTTGIVNGTPASNGAISFRVKVSDSGSPQSFAYQLFTVHIYPQLAISTAPALHFALVGQPYSLQLTTQAGTGGPAITWSAAPNSLPAGLTLDPTGLLHGTPSVSGSFSFAVQATDGVSPATLNATLIIYSPIVIKTTSLANGTYQQAYGPAGLTATGGSGSFVWSAAGLPAGLGVSGNSVQGTPTAAGSFRSITITVNDSISGQSASLNTSMTIYGPITITTSSLPGGTYQQTYAPVTMLANGGSGNFNWSATGLPSGLTMSQGGVISGSPLAGGTFSVTVSLSDPTSNQTASQPYSMNIGYTALSITAPKPIGIGLGGPVSTNLAVTGGLAPYTWTPVGSLPAGFSLTPAGALTGTPIQAGNISIPVQVADSEQPQLTAQTTVNVNVLGLSTTSPLPSGLTTATYSQTFMASGGTAPYSFLASGLPTGLSLSASGALNGEVKQPGTYSFSIQVSDNSGLVASSSYSLTISGPGPLTVSTPTLGNGTANAVYSASLSTAATGGSPPYQWSLQAGTLPAGITLSAAGILSGMPTVSGAYSFTVQATDGSGANASAPATLQINAAPLIITTQSRLPSGVVGIAYPQQILTASGGIQPYTFSLTLPDGLSPSGLSLNNGVISGTPSNSGNFSVGITVTDNAKTQTQTTLALNVRPPSADLVLSAGALSFALPAGSAALPSSESISVGSTDGTQQLGFSTQLSSGANWLMVSGGAVTPASLSVSLTSQASALAASTTPYTATITLTCNSTQCSSGDTAQTVTVSLLVTATPAQLNVETDLLSFSVTSASAAASSQPLNLQNSGGQSLGITSVSCEASWCSVGSFPASLDAGASIGISIAADPTGLPADYYRTAVDIVSSGGVASIPVTLLIAQASQIVLAPAGAQIEMPQGGTLGNPNGSFLVTVSGTATLSWTAAVLAAPSWLTLNTTSGSASGSDPGTINFSINQAAASALTAQAYYATIEVTVPGAVNSPQDFQVVFNVEPQASPLTPDPEPGGLVFIAEAGATVAPQTVQLFASSSSGVGYNASPSSGAAWLSISPSSGTTSSSNAAQSEVMVDTSSLMPGVYYSGVNYSFTTNPAAIRTVNVTLIVEPRVASPSAVSAHAPAAVHSNATGPACAPSTLAPTSTGLVNNFSAPASWPTPLSIVLHDDCGNTVSNGQVVVSFSNGDPPLALGLANNTTALYSGTWTPRNTGSQISLNARASATGFQDASIQLTGSVVPNVAPVLNKGGTLHVFNPQVGAAMAPGTIVQIYGSGLAAGIASATSIPLPTSLNGTSVIIGGVQAPLYFVSPGQINAQIPFELNPANQYQVIASANGALTTPITIQLAPVTPGFAAFADGGLIAQHASDGSLITQASPAQPGEYVVAYLAGMGSTSVPVATGGPSPVSPLAYAAVTPTLTLNGNQVPVSFAGMTPGLVGLYQLDFQIPQDAADGTITVVLSQSGFASNSTTLPVQH